MCSVWQKPPKDYCYKHEPRPKGKGGGVATVYSNIFSISQRSGFKYNSFEVMVLHITLSRETSVNDQSPVMFVLATVYRPPGHHTDFIKEFPDFLSELVLVTDKVLIVGDFNIHVDNEKDALGSAFIDILNSIGVRQHVSGPTHSRNHTLDLILSHDVNGVEVLQQSWMITEFNDKLPLTENWVFLHYYTLFNTVKHTIFLKYIRVCVCIYIYVINIHTYIE